MNESDVLKGIVDNLKTQFDVKRVVLFGSRARHTARDDSDFDILAIVESDIPYRRRQGVARAAVDMIETVELDLIVLTPNELARSMMRFDSVARFAMEEGSVLYAA